MGSPATRQGKIAVLGAGSWGLTLSWLLAVNGRQVALWCRHAEKAQRLASERVTEKPLAVQLPAGIDVSADIEECLAGADIVLFCCTAQSMRAVAGLVKPVLAAHRRANLPVLVSAAKGIELGTCKRMSEVLSETITGLPICALSGPNLAPEILRGMPAASVIGSPDAGSARFVQERISVPLFRLYTNTDLAGVELGGSLKNVIAIAAGAVDGLEQGTNAKAGLMTRGLAEMSRLAVALGARAATLSGLAGVGDLIATCYSSLSRNYRLGERLARGITLTAAEEELGAVAEGVTTTYAVCELSQTLGIELPIADQVEAALAGRSTPKQAIMTFLARPLASEG